MTNISKERIENYCKLLMRMECSYNHTSWGDLDDNTQHKFIDKAETLLKADDALNGWRDKVIDIQQKVLWRAHQRYLDCPEWNKEFSDMCTAIEALDQTVERKRPCSLPPAPSEVSDELR